MKSDPEIRDPRYRREGLFLLGGTALLVLIAAWQLRLPRGKEPDHASLAPVPRPGASNAGWSEDASASDPGHTGTTVAAAHRFRRAPVASSGRARRPDWEYRIRTNGVLEPDRLRTDPAYSRAVQRHLKLRSLLRSPARETPECAEIIALVERRGLTLAAVPDLYHALWEYRAAEQREKAASAEADRGSIGFVRTLALDDFMRRFRELSETDPAPVFEELVRLPAEPTVFFGPPDLGLQPGETLLTD